MSSQDNQKNKKDLNNNDNNTEGTKNNSTSLSLTLSNISLANPDLNKIEEKDYNKNQKLAHFVLGEKLGQGTFGFVRLATHSLTGEKVAIKILDKEKIIKEKDKYRLKNEIKILKKLRHNNIVQLYGVIDTKLSINLIMEYCEGEELLDYINRKQKLKEMEACKILQQLISGVEYLSKNKITHRDLKPENIIINNNLKIKIVDFGLSNEYKKDELLKSQCGSLCFASPEMISGKKYNGLSTDIWSIGVIIFSMICGYLPFQEEDTKILCQKITKGKYQVPYYVSQPAGDLIHKILNVNPNKRYNIEQIKRHKWFKMIDPGNNVSEGLLLDKYIIPLDDDVINIMIKDYEFNGEEVKKDIERNKHNLITTTYYLLLNKKIKEGKKSICNIGSPEFLNYLNDSNNLLEKHVDKESNEKVNENNEINEMEDKKNNEIKNHDNDNKDLVKEEMMNKLNKIHQEISEIKSKINTNKNNNKTQNYNFIKKIHLRKLILKENKINDYSRVRKKKILDDKIDNSKLPFHEISAIMHSTKSKKEYFKKDSDSSASLKKNKSHKKNMFRLINHNNGNSGYKKIDLKISLNTFKLKSKARIRKINKKAENNYKNISTNYNNHKYELSCNSIYSFSERKNFVMLNKTNKEKKICSKPEKRKDSNDLILSENKNKNKNSITSSNKTLTNSQLINKNNLLQRYDKESNRINNNISRTIYEKESENNNSLYPRKKNPNISQYITGNNKMDKDIGSAIKKQKYKRTLVLKAKSKKNIKEITLNNKKLNSIKNEEKQSLIKSEIKSSYNNHINNICQNNNGCKKRTYIPNLSNKIKILKKAKKNDINTPPTFKEIKKK